LERIKRGDFVGVRGPYGRAWPIADHAGSDIVIIAGGIGLAPLRPILYRVLRTRAIYGRLAIVYGARTPNDLLFKDELVRWADRRDLQLEVTVDRGDPDWLGHTGVVTKWINRLYCRAESSVAFVCGPDIMMRFAARELSNWGMDHEHIYVSGERNMKCALGWCGRCQLGPYLLCRDGPVFSYAEFGALMSIREL
jgi:NAD(P)H-flavin reductase